MAPFFKVFDTLGTTELLEQSRLHALGLDPANKKGP